MILLVLLLIIAGCGPPHHKRGPVDSSKDNSKKVAQLLETPNQIVYADVETLIFSKNCIECHSTHGGTKAGVNMESYQSLLGLGSKKILKPYYPSESSLYTTLLLPSSQSRHMPPLTHAQLSEDEIHLVYQWIINGALNDIQQKPRRPKSLQEELQPYFSKPESIDYKAVNKYIFETSCNTCHSRNGSKANFEDAIDYNQNMTTYKDLFSNFGIVPGQLQNKNISDGQGGQILKKGSRIYRSIAIKQSMPRAKDGYLPIGGLEVKLLRLWILNCAIEDFSLIIDDDLKSKPSKSGKIRNCN